MTATIDEVISAIADFGRSQVRSVHEANRRGGISKVTQKAERKAVATLIELCTGTKPEAKDIDAVIDQLS